MAYLHDCILIESIYAYQCIVVIPLSLLAKNEGQSLICETLQVLIEQHAAIDIKVPFSMLVFGSRMP